MSSSEEMPRELGAAKRGGPDAIDAELVPTVDRLMARIVDGEADEHDWGTFEALAASDAGVWRRLACSQRDAQMMQEVVRPALEAADRTRLPRRVDGRRTGDAGEPVRTPGLRRFGGWAAAAVIGLAWLGSQIAPMSASDRRAGTGQNVAGVVPTGWTIDSPEDAVKAYLDVGGRSGRVLGEMPDRVVVRTTPTAVPGQPPHVEVIYLRQFVERTVVTDLYELGTDELGRAVPVKLSIPQPREHGQASWQ